MTKIDKRRRDGQAVQMRKDYDAGMTLAQVGAKYGRNTTSVSQLFLSRGWKVRPRVDPFEGIPPKDLRRLRDPNRFWSKVKAEGDGSYLECWLWTACLNKKGYGQFKIGGTASGMSAAHRVSYKLMVGEIEDGLQLDHLCRNRACVNPWHLDPVTPAINSARGVAGKVSSRRQKAKTHCPRGHEYDEANTISRPSKFGGISRSCRACTQERDRRRKPRKSLLVEGLGASGVGYRERAWVAATGPG